MDGAALEHFRGGSGRSSASGPTNLPLGIVPGTEYEQFTVPLGDGDLLVLYTDHYIEAGTEVDRAPGIEGLLEMAQRCPTDDPEAFARGLESEMAARLDGAAIEDDRSLLVIRADPSARTTMSMGERMRGLVRGLVPASSPAPDPQTSDWRSVTFGPGNPPFDAWEANPWFGDSSTRSTTTWTSSRSTADPGYAPRRSHGESGQAHDFLCGWLGGPQHYVQKHGHPRLHATRPILHRRTRTGSVAGLHGSGDGRSGGRGGAPGVP